MPHVDAWGPSDLILPFAMLVVGLFVLGAGAKNPRSARTGIAAVGCGGLLAIVGGMALLGGLLFVI